MTYADGSELGDPHLTENEKTGTHVRSFVTLLTVIRTNPATDRLAFLFGECYDRGSTLRLFFFLDDGERLLNPQSAECPSCFAT